MLAELLERIVSLGRSADAAQILRDPALPRSVIIAKGEKFQFHDAEAPIRTMEIESMDDVLEIAQNEEIAPDAEVYFSPARIVVILNRREMREYAALNLQESKRFQAVRALELEPKSFSPKQAVKFIRYELHGVSADSLVAALGRIDFTRKSEGRHTVEHGKESLGRSVEMQVQQADKLPDAFNVTVPVFTNPGIRHTVAVQCGLYLDVEAERVEVRVLTDQVQYALDSAMASVRASLKPLTCPVYYGAPTWGIGDHHG